MKKRLIIQIGLSILGGIIVISCTSSDNERISTNSKILQSYQEVTTKIESTKSLGPTSAKTTFMWDWGNKIYATSIGSFWTNTANISLRHPEFEGSTPNISIKEYLDTQFNTDSRRSNGSATNVFGRMNDVLGVFCVMGLAITELDDEGFPDVGTHTFTFTSSLISSIKTTCSITFEDAVSMVGQTVTLNVEIPPDTTLFDKKMIPEMGFSDFEFFVRSTEDEINIATTEKNLTGDNIGHEYRTTVLYDLTTNTMRAEYLSVPASSTNESVYFYRLFVDATDTYVAIWESGADTEYRAYTGAGDTEMADTAAISFAVSDEANEATGIGDHVDLNGCIDRSTGTITSTTDTLICGKTLTSDQASSSLITLVSTILRSKTSTGWNTIDLTNGNINFTTDTNMYTQLVTIP